jgi:hypothetical protein
MADVERMNLGMLRATQAGDRRRIEDAERGAQSDRYVALADRLGVDPADVEGVLRATLTQHRRQLKAYLERLGTLDQWQIDEEERDLAPAVWRQRAELLAPDGPADHRDEIHAVLTAESKWVHNPDTGSMDEVYLSAFPQDTLEERDWMPDWSASPTPPTADAVVAKHVETLPDLADRHRRETSRLAGEAYRDGGAPADLPARQEHQRTVQNYELFDLLASAGYPEENLRALGQDWVRGESLAEKSERAWRAVSAEGAGVDRWLQDTPPGTRAPDGAPQARVHRAGGLAGAEAGIEAG